jgi:hypothetical protein
MRFGDDQDAQSQSTGKSFVRWSTLIANKTIIIVLARIIHGITSEEQASSVAANGPVPKRTYLFQLFQTFQSLQPPPLSSPATRGRMKEGV